MQDTLTPRVSIVLTSWNSGAYLPRCLGCLVAQTFQDFEVIVVDNGSTDGSVDHLEQDWPALKFHIQRMEKNTGFAVANNMGARLAHGRWLALLNTDAFPELDWLENLVSGAQQNPQFSFFASRQIQDRAPDRLDGCGDALHFSGFAWRRNYNEPADQCGLEAIEVFSACGAAAFYDRAAFLSVGGFDEDFFAYHEDVDLGFRLRLKGHRCLYNPRASVNHMGSASQGERSDFVFYHGHRNIIWSFVQNMPGGLFWMYFPAFLVANMYYLAYFTLRGSGKALWRAKIDALKGLKKALQKRKLIQQSRVVSNHDLVSVLETNLLDPYLAGYRAGKKRME
jgi:GT2 family glycosyltransferase